MKKIVTLHQHKAIISAIAMTLLLPACVTSSDKDSVLDITATEPAVDAVALEKKGRSYFFERFDSNKDKKVSAEEFSAVGSGRFKEDDTDKNGTLSRKEYMKAHSKRANARKEKQRAEKKAKRFAGMDTNKDGIVDKQEHIVSSEARAVKSFGNMDANKNNEISAWEYNQYQHPKHGKSMDRKYSPYKMFKSTDANEDGEVSVEESTASRMKWFDGMDIDGDKMVTPEEAIQAKENRKKDSEKKM